MFRRKFWVSLVLTLPTLVWGHMLQGALGYMAPHFPGALWIPAAFVAVEAGDIVLIRSDPRDVSRIIALSRASYRKMIHNLRWATGYNVVALPLAAGALASRGIVLSPAVGAVLMSASTMIVALNAQLLRRTKLA
jgi:cation transport ATPase